MLIEVVLGCALVVLVLTAVLAGLDASSATTGLHRQQGVASSLAEQDQERLRALPVTTLSGLNTVRTVTLPTGTYTISSQADWVRDASGTASCTNDTTSVDYLAITSSVDWAPSSAHDPISVHGIVAPPAGAFGTNRGTAAIQLLDRDGQPISNVPVTMNGPSTVGSTTDDTGCAVFGNVLAGAYTLTAQAPGLVDVSGATTLTLPVTVVAKSTRLFTASFDAAAQITASFNTAVAGVVSSVTAKSLTVTGSALPAPGTRVFTASPSPAATVAATSLFPMTGGYALYAGNCATADPRNPPTDNDAYYDTNPGQVATLPGGSAAVTIREPAIRVVAKKTILGILSIFPSADISVKPVGAGCETYPHQTATAAGALPAPAFPFGDYTVCADDNLLVLAFKGTVTIHNTDPAGTAVTTINMNTLGSCP